MDLGDRAVDEAVEVVGSCRDDNKFVFVFKTHPGLEQKKLMIPKKIPSRKSLW